MSKVISIFKKNDKKEVEKDEQDEGLSFEEIMKKNAEKSARMKRERERANKGVIRSYRLKPR